MLILPSSRAMPWSGWALHQGMEEKRGKIPWISHDTLWFLGTPFPSHLGRKRRLFLEGFVIFCNWMVPWFDLPLDQSQELKEENLIQEIYQCMFFMFECPSQSTWCCLLLRVLKKLDIAFCAEILHVISGRKRLSWAYSSLAIPASLTSPFYKNKQQHTICLTLFFFFFTQ